MLTCLLSDERSQAPPGVRTHELADGYRRATNSTYGFGPEDLACWSPPILRATDQAVSHSGYAWQTAKPMPDATPVSTLLTRPNDLFCARYPGSWGFLTVCETRCLLSISLT